MKVFKGWHPEQQDQNNGYHVVIKKNNQELITYYGAISYIATCDTGCHICSNLGTGIGVRCVECEYPNTLNTSFECKNHSCPAGTMLEGESNCIPCSTYCLDCNPLFTECLQCDPN